MIQVKFPFFHFKLKSRKNFLKEASGLTRLGLLVFFAAFLCIFVQLNVTELRINELNYQVRPASHSQKTGRNDKATFQLHLSYIS